MAEQQHVIVQASSRSWSGGQDLCMNSIDGYPVVYWTVKRILERIPGALVTVAAPAFDRAGQLEFLKTLRAGSIRLFYGHDESPLDRILAACQHLDDDDYIIRIDGLHFCVDVEAGLRMLDQAKRGHLDCVKLPDDFPVQFTSDVYRIGALRMLSTVLHRQEDAVYRVHPKFFLFAHQDIFRCAYAEELPTYPDEYLRECRQAATSVYHLPRQEVNELRIWAGDQLTFHYEIARQYLQPWMRVLDVACGNGFGTRTLSQKVAEVHGVDIDPHAVDMARRTTPEPNVRYYVDDATKMNFTDGEFDAVTSMETIEHIDPYAFLGEIHRVLKPGGLAIISTPQNRMGHIPINAAHLREYSLEEIIALCSSYFSISVAMGIKAGRIVIPGDPLGTNTVLVCTKRYGI